ncbi:alpha/beta hydrolase [Variovorax sp. WS11]|nr:alpha/beta hydrolase [Variovorax sp. WS11]PSL80107.1 alpha/beta hydrolase [Variovorax sp. WS11]
MIMHPRELLVTHYMVPALVQAGYACWVQGARTVGNDIRLEHEVALLDVAAGVGQLRSLAFKKIVMLGNSGGAPLFAFYNQQALTDSGRRLGSTPGGRPVKLADVVMPEPDGFVFVAPHGGQGALLMNCIDPSVVDERDPLSVDSSLDPFSEANGFRPRPQSAQYAAEFMGRYRAAQRRRVERIDAAAKAMITERMAARGRSRAGRGNRRDDMAGALNAIFQVWRTDADPRAFDLTLDPSDRRWGTVWGSDPMASNLGAVGFGRICTPEGWLSTWSGLSSNASFERCGASVQQPSLVIYYTGDNTVFPSDVTAIFETLATREKQRIDVKGNHHGHALAAGEELPQSVAVRAVVSWLDERFR